MLNFFKAKLDDLSAAASKFRDRETAEAIVAVMTGTAYADGELEASEKQKLASAFRIHPVLKQYDTSILTNKFADLSTQFDLDVDVGFDACISELRDMTRQGASEEKRIAVLRMGVAAAKADGEIEDAERAFLVRCANTLGLSPSQVGL